MLQGVHEKSPFFPIFLPLVKMSRNREFFGPRGHTIFVGFGNRFFLIIRIGQKIVSQFLGKDPGL